MTGFPKLVRVLYTSILFKGCCLLISAICAGLLFHLARQIPAPETPIAVIGIAVFGILALYIGYSFDRINRSSLPLKGSVKFDFIFWLIIAVLAAMAVFAVFNSVGEQALSAAILLMMILFIFNLIAGMSIHTTQVWPKQTFGLTANVIALATAMTVCFIGLVWVGIPLVRMAGNQPGAVINFVLGVLFAIGAAVPLTMFATHKPQS